MAKKETKENLGRIASIIAEGSKIRWASPSDLCSGFFKSVVFIGFFALFFTVCDLLSAVLIKGIG